MFGVDPDHLVFEYTRTDGRRLNGSITYSGTKLVNDLLLTVNPANGQVQLKNDSPYDIFVQGYTVSSTSGSLVPGTWSSLQDQGATGWEEGSFNTATGVGELKSNGSFRLTSGSGYNLGALAKSTGGGLVQDLKLQFLETWHTLPTDGTVVYGALGSVAATTAGVLGDFNNNGTVDAADYVMWRDALGKNVVLRNDPVGGTIGTSQYTLWRTNFGNATAGGAGSSLGLVPEPNSAFLLIAATVLAAGASRGARKRRQ